MSFVQVSSEPGHGLPDLRHVRHLLRPPDRHPVPVLAHLPGGQEEDPTQTRTRHPTHHSPAAGVRRKRPRHDLIQRIWKIGGYLEAAIGPCTINEYLH